MNLIVDIGNTGIKLAVFNEKNKLIYFTTVERSCIFDKLDHIIHDLKPAYALISCVGEPVNPLDEYLNKKNIRFFHLSYKLKLPFKIAYKTPATIGADRLGLVAGALLYKQNTHQLIIDAGTCVTYDFVDKDNIYRGGAISPGLQLRYKALNNYTANLPLLSIPKNHVPLIGTDTTTSIQSGVIRGLANEIEGFIVKYNLKYTPLTVYLTGGDEKLLDSYIKNKIFVNSKFLLLEGMNHILNLNK